MGVNSKELAYMQVNNIVDAGVISSAEHQEIINNAVELLIKYDDCFKDETESLKIQRNNLSNESDKSKLNKITNHFKKLYGGRFKNMGHYQIVYTMYNRMNADKSASEINKNSHKKMEERNMANKNVADETKKTSEDLIKQAQDKIQKGAGKDMTGSMPSEDQTSRSYIAEVVDKQVNLDDRNKTTATAKVNKIILVSRPASERCVAGENAVGRIKNPSKALEKIVDIFGIKENEDGSVNFTKIVNTPENLAAAQEMYDDVKKACVDGTYTIKANVNKNASGIKGTRYVNATGDADIATFPGELRDFIIKNTGGLMLSTIPGGAVQFQLAKAAVRKSKGNQGVKQKTLTKEQKISKICTVQISNRKDAIANADFIEYWKELNKDKVDWYGGLTSKVAVRFKSDKVDANENPIIRTYRLRLEVEQYESAVVDQEFRTKWGDGKSVAGRSISAIDVTDSEAIKKMNDILKGVMINITETVNEEEGMFHDFRVAAEEKAQADVTKEAEDFNDAF